MHAGGFFVRLKRKARGETIYDDPLKEAQQFIDQHGKTGQGDALRRVVEALWRENGEFSESDIAFFSSPLLDLISQLIDARITGRYPEWQWERASCHPPWHFLLALHKRYGIE